MSTSLDQFVRESIQRARTELSYQDALEFLRRTVAAFDDDRVEDIARFREIVLNLNHCDRQLVLIADGQLRLDFDVPLFLPVLSTSFERLRWARRHRKITLARLAAKSGFSVTKLHQFSTERTPAAPDAALLERILELPAGWLLTGADAPLPTAA